MPQRLWQVELVGDHTTRATAVLFAASNEDAGDLARVETQEGWDAETFTVISVEAVRLEQARVLDLHVRDLDVPQEASSHGRVWWVPWQDGLFQRHEGASLVIADDETTATHLVAEADPFEGQPPYGKPPSFGPAQTFDPTEPTLIRIDYDWDD